MSIMICSNRIQRSDGEYIGSVESNGHAGYAEEGQDIVCAAVSASDCKYGKFRGNI